MRDPLKYHRDCEEMPVMQVIRENGWDLVRIAVGVVVALSLEVLVISVCCPY